MSKAGISSLTSFHGGSSVKGSNRVLRFLGLSLAGGKTDKACLALLEYYPDQKRIFLSKIYDKIKSDATISGDLKIHEIIEQYQDQVELLAVDVPWEIPLCFSCKLNCPGYENCREEHIHWMWKWSEKHMQPKKPKKVFTPYTQRAAEMYMATELEEKFLLPHVMGSNSAPLVARAAFILRRLNVPVIEVFPKLSIWRIGTQFGVQKSHLRSHRSAVSGESSRRAILKSLVDRNIAFIYEQDSKLMVENSHAFDSFICALTAFLKHQGLTEERPEDFPSRESWIEFPQKKIAWGKSVP